jgi:hypothetical protein
MNDQALAAAPKVEAFALRSTNRSLILAKRLRTCIGLIFAPFLCLGLKGAQAEAVRLEPYWEQQAPGLVVATLTIDGRPARLLFDTGAAQTIVTPAFAQTIGCTPYGSQSGFRMRGDRVVFRKCGAHHVAIGGRTSEKEIGVFDLSSLLPRDAPQVDGIAGVDVLDGRRVTLELANRTIRLDERPGRGWSEGATRFQREQGGAGLSIFVRGKAQTGDLWLLLDSGHLGPIFLSAGAIEQLGTPLLETPIRLAVSGTGEQLINAVRIDGLLYDGVLGEPFMRKFEIAIDFRNQRIWWRPTLLP